MVENEKSLGFPKEDPEDAEIRANMEAGKKGEELGGIFYTKLFRHVLHSKPGEVIDYSDYEHYMSSPQREYFEDGISVGITQAIRSELTHYSQKESDEISYKLAGTGCELLMNILDIRAGIIPVAIAPDAPQPTDAEPLQ